VTEKTHHAERSLALLDAGGVANRIMATADGVTMAMQQASAGLLAPGTAIRAATKIVATSNPTWASTPEMQAAADYLCDGVADEVQINAAVTALGATGGTVLLAEGLFRLAGPVVLAAGRCTIRGLGMNATTLMAADAGGSGVNTVLVQMSNDDQALSDLTIDGNKANNPTATGQYGVQAVTARLLIERVRIANTLAFGLVTLNTVANGVVRDCLIESVTGQGAILRAAAGQPLVVSSCVFQNNGSHGANCDDGPVTLSDCQSLSNGGYGFVIGAADVRLTGCTAQSNTLSGFTVSGANVSLTNCRAISSTPAGFETTGARTQFVGCSALGTLSPGGNGFRSEVGSTDALYSGCLAQGSQSAGFRHVSAGRATYVGCQALANTSRGFYADAGEMQIKDCVVVGLATSLQGINLIGGANHSIDGCRIMTNGQEGINVADGVPSVQITNNFISDSSLLANATSYALITRGDATFAHGNVFRDPAAGNRPPYAIAIGSVSDNSLLGHNDTYGSGVTGEVFVNNSNTRRVATLRLDYTATTDLVAGAIAAQTWTDVVPNQSFVVGSPGSLVEIMCRGSLLVGATTAGAPDVVRLVIDSATTPIYKMLSGEGIQTTAYQNILGSGQPIKLQGLAAGTHTVKLQLYMYAAGAAYLRCATAAVQEHLAIQVTEYGR
jgi:hypothetical protein